MATALPNQHPTTPGRPQSRIAWGPTTQMVLLIGLGAMLVVKVLTGHILLYVNGIYTRLILAAGIAFIVLGYIAGLRWLVRRGDETHARNHGDHAHATGRIEALGYAMLAVPLLLGLLVPAHPLGSAAVASRSNGAEGASVSSGAKALSALDADTGRWTLLDWAIAVNQTPDVRTLAGKRVSVVGFVAPGDSGLGAGYLTLARFVIVCCVADGNAVTLPVQWETPLNRDTWVQVTGTIAISTAGGRPTPYIEPTSVQPIPQPGQPYLYP